MFHTARNFSTGTGLELEEVYQFIPPLKAKPFTKCNTIQYNNIYIALIQITGKITGKIILSIFCKTKALDTYTGASVYFQLRRCPSSLLKGLCHRYFYVFKSIFLHKKWSLKPKKKIGSEFLNHNQFIINGFARNEGKLKKEQRLYFFQVA